MALLGAAVLLFSIVASARAEVQGGAAPQAPLRVSLKQAIGIALSPEGNYQVQLARQSLRLADAQFIESRAALMPSLSGSLAEQNQLLNLTAMGVRLQTPIPGVLFPESSGSYNTLDARVTASLILLDMSALQRTRAFRKGSRAAQEEAERVKDRIASQVAQLYLGTLRAQALVAAAEEGVNRAKALLDLAEQQASAGKGTRLDVTRARSQLADDRQRLLADEIRRTRARLGLLRAMRLSLDAVVELTDQLDSATTGQISLEEALAIGAKSRVDLAAQEERVAKARLNDSAAWWRRLPSVAAYGDYGPLGAGADRPVTTHTAGISLKTPFLDGGAISAQRAASLAELREEEIRSGDLRAQIELEIRESLESLRLAKEQADVAQEALSLAQDELEQARRRYEAGVTNNVEVVEAQTRLARAQEQRADALFGCRQARIDLWLAMGVIRAMIEQDAR